MKKKWVDKTWKQLQKKIKKDQLELAAESDVLIEAVEVGIRIFVNL